MQTFGQMFWTWRIKKCNIYNYSIYHKDDTCVKSPRIEFRTGFPGQYRGLIRVISTFGGRVKDGYLFSYFEYEGEDFEADMRKMAADLMTQKWWDICKPCHEPLETRAQGEWWANMEEVFHYD